ncbi:MAG: DUF4292 domain-containing protein [Flavobacterium sp.]|nr:DUF4292 domain-containing protein [Flavobacterium sp.]
MKKYIALVLVVALASCKAKTVIAEAKATQEIPTKTVVENHYANKKDFKTLYIKASARYEDDKQSQNVTAEIKILKDEKILISIRVLGITMAKAMITPKEVKYYEKLGGKFFEGDYALLSKWLGTDLDYSKVQNMLIGQSLDDLTKGKYKTSIEDKLYKLETASAGIEKTFYFEASKFLIKKEEITQTAKNRSLQVAYPNHKDYPTMNLPAAFLIEAFNEEKKTTININYNTATFNEELSFPYSVPDGYDRILIE